MKKLMFAAAAIAAGVAMADVSSANIVGYTDKALRMGNMMLTPCFAKIGASGYTLADVAVKGYDPYDPDTWEGGTSADVCIKILASNGAVAKDKDGNDLMYYFFDDMDTDESMGGLGAGWYNLDKSVKFNVGDVSFPAGFGLWVYGADGLNLVAKAPLIK